MRRNYDNSHVRIGDIIHCGWGATMTIHEFYQVTEVNGRTQCTIIPIISENTGGKGMYRIGIRVAQPIIQSGDAKRVYVMDDPHDDNAYIVIINKYKTGRVLEDVNEEFVEDSCGN